MNVGKSKVMVFVRKEVEVYKVRTFERVNVPAERTCGIVLGSETTQEVNECQYFVTVL